MFRKKLIGYAVTDANGVASYTYTGVGDGEIDIIAESKGALVVEDSTSLFNDNTWFTRGTAETTVYKDNSSGSSALQTYFSSTFPIDDGKVIEFEVTDCTYCRFQVSKYQTGNSNYYKNWTITEKGNVKIFIFPSKVEAYLNDELLSQDNNANNGTFSFFFQVASGNVADFKYTNFVVYSYSDVVDSDVKEITDCSFLDNGIDGTQTNYYNTSNAVTVTYDDTGKTFSNNTSTSRSIYPVKADVTPSSTNLYCFDCDFAVEFDLVEFGTVSSFQVGDGTNNFYRQFRYLDCTTNNHIRYEIKSNSQKIFVDGVEKYSDTISFTTALYMRFNLNASYFVKIKNFKVYPI